MNLPMRIKCLLATACFLLCSACFAQTTLVPTGLTKKAKEEPKEPNVPDTKDKASIAEVEIEDASPLFAVKEITISGNMLIPTVELLQDLPTTYSRAKADVEPAAAEVYNFTVVQEIINNPGQARKISQKTIQGLTLYLLSVYQKKGYAGIYIYVPAKAVQVTSEGVTELAEGILPIRIIEGRVGNISIKRYDFNREVSKGVLDESVFSAWIPIDVNEVIQKKQLDDFVRLLNVNPDRYISAVVTRGTEPNSLNLGFDVYEVNPWHWYYQIDNSGINKHREWTPRIGLVNTNLTGQDDELSIMYQSRPDSWEAMKENYSLYGRYEIPLWTPRLRVGVFGGYSQFDLAPGSGVGIGFRGNGSFYGGSLRYNVFQVNDWLIDFVSMYTHEKSRSTPTLFKAFLEKRVSMNLLSVGAEVHRSDDVSKTSVGFDKTTSIGGGSGKSDFGQARSNAEAKFSIYTISASHKRFLDRWKIHEVSGIFRSINSDERLVPSKMTSFGGLYSVRGYLQDEVIADGGVLTTFQYKFDLDKYFEKQYPVENEVETSYKKETWPPSFSFLTFIDYGRAKIKHPIIGERSAYTLLSGGPGIGTDFGESFSSRIYYAWPLKDANRTRGGDAGSWYFNFIYRF